VGFTIINFLKKFQTFVSLSLQIEEKKIEMNLNGEDPNLTRSRLDRILIYEDCLDLWQTSRVWELPRYVSYHFILLLRYNSKHLV